MPAVQETVDQVRRIDVDQYKYGFETDIESDKAPKGLSEDTVRFISAKKNEPRMDARLAARGLSPLADHARAAMGARRLRADRLPGPLLLFGAEEEPGAEIARRGRSGDSSHLREARHSAARAGNPRRRRARRRHPLARRGRCGVRFGVGGDHLQGGAEEGRRDLHADLGGDARASGPGAAIYRLGGADHRQLLRHAQFRGVLRRLVRLRAAGRALPDGAVDLFPHQRAQYRPVRAHADHRRQGLLCELSGRLHGAARATRTSCMPPWSS